MSFNQVLQISEQDLRTVQALTQPSGASFTPSIKYGQLGGTSDGRQYVFGLNNATNAALPGNLQTAIPLTTGHFTRTNATVEPIGSTTVVVPLASNAATVNQYAQGYLTVVSGTGAGINYRIKSNTAATSSGSTTVSLLDPLVVALDTTSVLSLYPNPWSLFIISSTTVAVNNIVGVPNVNIPASNYGWLQVDGYCSVLSDGAITKNAQAVVSGNTAGAATIYTTSLVSAPIGYAPELTITTDYTNLVLQIQ